MIEALDLGWRRHWEGAFVGACRLAAVDVADSYLHIEADVQDCHSFGLLHHLGRAGSFEVRRVLAS